MFLKKFYTSIGKMGKECPVLGIPDIDTTYSFAEAANLCEKGFFMTHRSFDSTQSMHYWKGSLD